jgi:catalase
MRQTINRGRVSYHPNSLGGGCPFQATMKEGGFTSYTERIDGTKIRERSASFFDHFSQARLFYNSQSEPEKAHIANALCFELSMVETVAIRERMLRILLQINEGLATEVALGLGLSLPKNDNTPLNQGVPADADIARYQPVVKDPSIPASAALSMANTVKGNIATRQIAFLVADGVNEEEVTVVKAALEQQGALVALVAPRLGHITTATGNLLPADKSLLTAASVFYDAVYIPGGLNSVASLAANGEAVHFVNEAYKHCKAIAATLQGTQVLETSYFARRLPADSSDETVLTQGLVIADDPETLSAQFIKAIGQHRFWEREKPRQVPA